MNDLKIMGKIPKALAAELADIERLGDCNELRKLLIRSLSVTVESIIRLAAIVRRLEELGDDLSDIEISLLPQIRKVAYGQVVPELLMRLQGKPGLLRRASALPIPDQRRIAEGEPLKVMQADGDHRLVPPLKMNLREINQVFGRDSIRDEAEQAAWLRERTPPVTKSRTWEEEIVLDRKRGGIIVGKRFIPASDLLHYASQLSETARTRH